MAARSSHSTHRRACQLLPLRFWTSVFDSLVSTLHLSPSRYESEGRVDRTKRTLEEYIPEVFGPYIYALAIYLARDVCLGRSARASLRPHMRSREFPEIYIISK